MVFNIEMIPNYRIAYVRQVGPYGPANVHAMQKLKQWAGERNLLTRSAILFGIPQDNPLTTPPDSCRYDACIVLPDKEPIDQAVCEGRFAGTSYAVCKIKHTSEEVQKAWAEIFPALQRGGYRIADKPIVERYTGDLLDNEYCEICVPLSDSGDCNES